MQSLALNMINDEAPYKVFWYENSRTYRFKTDYDVMIPSDDNFLNESCSSHSEKESVSGGFYYHCGGDCIYIQ